MDNLDTLRQQWQQQSARTAELEEANRRLADTLSRQKAESLQDRLGARFSRFGWIGLILPALAPLLFYVINLPWWVAVFYGAFGVVMSALNFWLSEFILSKRLADMPVAEAIERATRIRMRQSRTTIFGIIMAIPLIASMGMLLPNGPERESILIGGAVGLVIGAVIGIHRLVVNARITRELLDSVKK